MLRNIVKIGSTQRKAKRLKRIAFDTETCLIRPANLAPSLVCVTWQENGKDAQIEHAANCEQLFAGWLVDHRVVLVGHNVAYDLAVVGECFPHLVPLIFAAYEADRVTDTKVRQQLLDIAAGCYRGRFGDHGKWLKYEYTLEALARRCAGMQLQKDAWRLSYGEFLDVPLTGWVDRAKDVQKRAATRLTELGAAGDKKEIEGLRAMVESPPEQCLRYCLDDARATLAVYLAQEKHAAYLDDQYRQARAAFALHLSSAWGLRTDTSAVAAVREQAEAQRAELERMLIEAGLVREDGSRNTKVATARMLEVCKREGLPIRRTASHTEECEIEAGICVAPCHVSLDADACNATEDEILVAYAELSTTKKVLSNDVEMLQQGTYYPIHPRYDIAETGRTTCSKPNIQNLSRGRKCKACSGKGCDDCGGVGSFDLIRPAIRPRPGKVFAQADYPQLELYTLAQCCVSWVGFSKLADALNAGLDPHLAMAAQICRVSYDEAARNKKRPDIDNARQTAKVANFGFPGGLGIEKLILFAKKAYGVVLSEKRAKDLKAQWFETWPEMPHYFARINALCDNDRGKADVESLFTKRFRGAASYCAACNSGFQALGSDCAKNAAWEISRAAYVDIESPLYNARLVAFVHDEFIVEVADNEKAHYAAHALAEIMVSAANVYLPNVPIPLSKLDPLLMRRWSKKAEVRLDERGRLIPWH